MAIFGVIILNANIGAAFSGGTARSLYVCGVQAVVPITSG